MRLIKTILLTMALFSFSGLFAQKVQPSTVLICYGKVNPDQIKGYKYVILESEHYTAFDVKLIKENNESVIGYISLGEVSGSRFYYDALKGNTLGKNEIWGSYYLNLRDETTQNVLISFVDKMVKKGFDGLFLDTVDTFAEWGPYPNMGPDLVNLLRLIKDKYPKIHLMQNAGLSLISKSAKYIDSIAIESVATNYSFDNSEYRMHRWHEFYKRVEELQEIRKKYQLPIILIEYADSEKLYKKVKQQIAPLKWDYFIGTIGLQSIPKFK
ncbi:endo alpha-1,4 polygalactosaminidase [Roseivirga sp.]|uniref:endo alpha-1,4 polygalactosaminidase n=1 Tax=Roseivirga sp. TaxID=1964215 RepID=UPI002B269F8B|nr:endo alpha-1,4 polygalactosaminidase [Roseivirga sp.]